MRTLSALVLSTVLSSAAADCAVTGGPFTCVLQSDCDGFKVSWGADFGPAPDGCTKTENGGGGGGSVAGAACDTAGGSATYAEVLTTDSSGVGVRAITATGCPNHHNVKVAPNPNEAAEQNVNAEIPSSPVLRASYGYNVAASDTSCDPGAVAYALNGVQMFAHRC